MGHFRFAELFLRVQLNKPVVRRKLEKMSSSSKSSLMEMLTGTYVRLGGGIDSRGCSARGMLRHGEARRNALCAIAPGMCIHQWRPRIGEMSARYRAAKRHVRVDCMPGGQKVQRLRPAGSRSYPFAPCRYGRRCRRCVDVARDDVVRTRATTQQSTTSSLSWPCLISSVDLDDLTLSRDRVRIRMIGVCGSSVDETVPGTMLFLRVERR